MKVAKWGNSLAIRIPAAVVEALELKEGDDVELRPAGMRTMDVDKKDREALLARLRKYRGLLPRDFKFDRAEIHERR